MVRLFKGMTTLSVLASIGISVFLSFFLKESLFFFSVFGLSLLFFLLFNLIINKKFAKASNLLTQKLEVNEYAQSMLKILKIQSNKDAVNSMIHRTFCGFYYLGDAEMAKRLLDSVILPKLEYDEKNLNQLIMYYKDLAQYHLLIEDLDGAEMALLNMRSAIDADNTGSPTIEQLKFSYMSIDFLIKIHRGIFDGAEYFFKTRLLLCSTPLQRLEYSYNLAMLYYLQKRYDEAVSYFNFVIDNGKELYFTRKSMESLSKIKASQ